MARILAVDDTLDVLNYLKVVLSAQGHEVVGAEDAMTAMERLDAFHFDLMICDIEMPHTNGFQLLSGLRNSPRFKFLPVIMLTARNSKEDIERSLKYHIDDYIVKPVQKEILLDKVSSFLKNTPVKNKLSLKVSGSSLPSKATLTSKTTVSLEEVSDMGFVLSSERPFRELEKVEVTSAFFSMVGITPVPMQVSSQIFDEESRLWKIQLIFTELNREISQKIRQWINLEKA